MTGLPFWDAAIWAILGLIAGVLLARRASPRAAMVFALFVALAGFLLVPAALLFGGENGPGYAMMVLFWSVPTTSGLVLGTILSRIRRQD